jgi:hypothetical protein
VQTPDRSRPDRAFDDAQEEAAKGSNDFAG